MVEMRPQVAATSDTRYELPPGGITLLGYVVRSGDGQYTAQMTGVITSELVPGFLVSSRIRAHGKLDLQDGSGNKEMPKLARSGEAELVIEDAAGARLSRRVRLAP